MKFTMEGIQPADGEERVADSLHQRQLGLHPGECVEAQEITLNRKGKLYNNIIKYQTNNEMTIWIMQ